MYDELPVYEVEEISLEEAVVLLVSENTISISPSTLQNTDLHSIFA